jgi:hypothetical protein
MHVAKSVAGLMAAAALTLVPAVAGAQAPSATLTMNIQPTGGGVAVVRGITSHHSTTSSGSTVTWNLPSAIGSDNTVMAYSHQSTYAPTSITDNAGNSYTLSSSVVWNPYNEPILMWYKVGVTGNPTQIFINYAGPLPPDNFCDCAFVEYSGATGVDAITGPINQVALNPSMTISPTASSSLLWVFGATDTEGGNSCQDGGNGNMISPGGYSVLIDDCGGDGVGVLGSPGPVGPGPVTFTWQDTYYAGPSCSDLTPSSSCSTVMMGASIH